MKWYWFCQEFFQPKLQNLPYHKIYTTLLNITIDSPHIYLKCLSFTSYHSDCHTLPPLCWKTLEHSLLVCKVYISHVAFGPSWLVKRILIMIVAWINEWQMSLVTDITGHGRFVYYVMICHVYHRALPSLHAKLDPTYIRTVGVYRCNNLEILTWHMRLRSSHVISILHKSNN